MSLLMFMTLLSLLPFPILGALMLTERVMQPEPKPFR